MQTIRIDSLTVETLRPLGKVKIQPIHFSNSLDQGKRLAITRCIFHGPRDLTASFSGIIDGNFGKVKDIDQSTSDYQVVFQSSVDVNSFGKIKLQSASTFESLTVNFDLPQTSKTIQTNFPFTSCKFGVLKLSDEQTTNYSAIATECGKITSNEIYLYFPVKLTEWDSAKYADISSSFYHSPETTANVVIKTGKLANDGVDINSLDFSIQNFYGTKSPLSNYLTWSFRLK
ncbi:uncharacterized protein LOC134273802 [Saccostrea cucullata]|uniref:uncharacterized protein LOC134273802 n=1 Tax=Saccostrea cuccullata TaxID=36930 RepID=UPI002ED3321A